VSASVLVICAMSTALAFIVGWWKGQRDLEKDAGDDLDRLMREIEKIPTSCASCGGALRARCVEGCPPTEEG